ncbi:MAG: glycosyltransferase [Acidobacteria bacterium]|nr:glycosyltransferase [Acidobacteriota bacterium]
MKILFCKNSFAGPISGADEIVVSYALELKAAGHSPSVLLVHPPVKDDPMVTRLRAAGVPLSALASTTFSASLAAGRKLAIRAMRLFKPGSLLIRSNSRKLVFNLLERYHDACCEYLKRHRPDVVHVMTPDPGAVMLIRAAHAVGVPVVYQEAGTPFHPPGFEEVYERFVAVLPLCTEVAVLSPSLAREMTRAVPHVTKPYVLPLICSNLAPPGAAPPSKSSNGNGSVRFGFAARLEHLKGPLQFVEGFRITHRAHPSVEMKVAGEGSQRDDIVRAIRRLGLEGKSRLVGTYTTPAGRSRFMQETDVFVLPSLTEGTPNAIIEAMAHARPVIAAEVGGIPDLVTEDVGILFPPGDTDALGAAMTRLATDPELRLKMGQAARKRYEQLFTPHAVLPLLVNFYHHVISGHNGGHNGNSALPEVTHPWAEGD